MTHFDDDCYHSCIACGPDSIEPKLVVRLINVKHGASAGEPTQYLLRCSLAQTDLEWVVERRYTEFRELHKALQTFFLRRGGGATPQCFGCAWFTQTLSRFWFPRRHWLKSRTPAVVNQRRVALSEFVHMLAAHTFSAVPKCVSCADVIFPQARAFFLRDAILPKKINLQRLERALRAENFSPVTDPNKSKLEFRKKRTVWKVLQMETPVFSKLSEFELHQQKRGNQRRRRQAAWHPRRREDRWRDILEASHNSSIVSSVCEA